MPACSSTAATFRIPSVMKTRSSSRKIEGGVIRQILLIIQRTSLICTDPALEHRFPTLHAEEAMERLNRTAVASRNALRATVGWPRELRFRLSISRKGSCHQQ